MDPWHSVSKPHDEPSDLILKLQGWRLATAEIIYRMPDHPSLLQSFIWQHLDLAPAFPRLSQFLDFWEREIDGPLHAVKVARSEILEPGDLRHVHPVAYVQ